MVEQRFGGIVETASAKLSRLRSFAASRHEEAVARYTPKSCKGCAQRIEYAKRKFDHCSAACFYSASRLGRAICLTCGKDANRSNSKYCSLKCQKTYEYKAHVAEWLAGEQLGGGDYGVAGYVKRWLRETRGEKCELCGWRQKHPSTGEVPIQVDHADGNPENHRPENLRLLCPNCHSLTASFGGRNKGHGRKTRRLKYESKRRSKD